MNSPLRIWHPFTNSALDPPPIPVERAEGVWLHTKDGGKIIDAISSWWVNLHGHSNPRIAAAIAEQARKMEHVIFAGFTHEPAEKLAAGLRKWLAPQLTHLFFSDDGSTAVEVALKLAVQYFSNQGRVAKKEIVALEHGYHGDTAGAMSVSDDSPFTDPFRSMRYAVQRVPSPYLYRRPAGMTPEGYLEFCIERLEESLQEKADSIACMIVEPLLQAAGGMIVYPAEYLRRARELCTQFDVLLIADEVLTGFGRTGKMFACDLAAIVPDLVCLSKGITGGFLPMGVTICTDRVEAAFRSENRMHTFYHGHSYTGNALACVAANASLQIFEEEPVFDRIAAIARINRERLEAFGKYAAVGETRQIGTMGAIELRAEDAGYLSAMRPKLYQFFLDRGVLLRPLGNVVYVLPPYVILPDELNHVYDVIEEAVQSLF
ncbi:MAG: adenosylmethionine--8-amino-7-oxononanoate transaminase [Acidobacteria bacterium]|nr:adenosylmethionine--8-amino-7-oxononanoate transaminase [Acidobacteriota bacterium]MBS1867371.1 adenosylmethionine--8-amino-7-oxononanoate transaminase [Acidobacteriota bacterium]